MAVRLWKWIPTAVLRSHQVLLSPILLRWPPSSSSPDPEIDAEVAAIPLLVWVQRQISKLARDLHRPSQTSLESPGHTAGQHQQDGLAGQSATCGGSIQSAGIANACRLDMSCCLERAY